MGFNNDFKRNLIIRGVIRNAILYKLNDVVKLIFKFIEFGAILFCQLAVLPATILSTNFRHSVDDLLNKPE